MFARRTTWTLRSRNRSSVVGGELEDLPDAADELRRGVHAASAALDRTGTAGPDAVIEAWLALEAAASSSGTPRRPSQTPTEFTDRLLREHHADAGSVTLLRGLYLRARYSAHPHVSGADVTSARQALTSILDTLGTPDRADAP
nr:DUF4129 domain-containing protein [Phytoactinopolyspora alkaliphila]